MLRSLLNRVRTLSESLQSGSAVRRVLLTREAEILESQREQLFDGKRSDGEDIRPYYSEDLKPSGYFHSAESAGRYAAWKEDISPYSAGRNPDAPNLYINGRFHSELAVDFGADTIAVIGGTGYAQGIVAKYGLSTFGLSPERWNEIFQNGALADLIEETKQILYE